MSDVEFSKKQIDAYGWKSLAGIERGKFMELDKNILFVDLTYQRVGGHDKVIGFAKNWAWIACGTITVAKRRDGAYFVVDGQNRVIAARKRSDIRTLPCMVYDVECITDEARAFLLIQIGRKSVTALEKFAAELVCEDSNSISLKEIVEHHGYSITKSGGDNSLRCVAAAKRCLVENKKEFERTFELLTIIHNGAPISEYVMRALFFLSVRTNGATCQKPYRDTILNIGLRGLEDATRKAAVFYSNRQDKTLARGIVEVLNKRRSTNRINIFDDKNSQS